MSVDQIAAEALRLSPRNRALLAESLWESLGDPHEASNDTDDAGTLALAIERDRLVGAGEVKPMCHEELMSRLRRER